jgi:ppGpp synthetase/RelA/SpoT-type nucleotidyltranferase
MAQEQILSEFARQQSTLETLAARLDADLRDQLAAAGIPVQFVASRTKRVDSLHRKLARPDKTYAQLWDVTDLVGLRIATWFEDAIEDVARLIERTYAVDFTHSTDKSRWADTARFGYRSVHYVCSLPDGPSPDFRFEIQVRTALQHAWAEVEHDLGYKADAVPAPIRRRFSRVASLLEVADLEFVEIRRALEAYQRTVGEALGRDDALPLDELSVAALAKSDTVAALDTALAGELGVPLGTSLYFPRYLMRLLRLGGLATTADVRHALDAHGPALVRLGKPYLTFARRRWGLTLDAVERGYSLFFLAHAKVLETPERTLSKVARLTVIYEQLDGLDEKLAHELASALVAALS